MSKDIKENQSPSDKKTSLFGSGGVITPEIMAKYTSIEEEAARQSAQNAANYAKELEENNEPTLGNYPITKPVVAMPGTESESAKNLPLVSKELTPGKEVETLNPQSQPSAIVPVNAEELIVSMRRKSNLIKSLMSKERSKSEEEIAILKNLKVILHDPPKYKLSISECTKDPPHEEITAENWAHFKDYFRSDLCNHFSGIPEVGLLDSLVKLLPSSWGNEQMARSICQIQGNLLMARLRYSNDVSAVSKIKEISEIARMDTEREWDTARSMMQKLAGEYRPLLEAQKKLVEETTVALKQSLETTTATHHSLCQETFHASKVIVAQFTEGIQRTTGKTPLELSKIELNSGPHDGVKNTISQMTKPVATSSKATNEVMNLGEANEMAKIQELMAQFDVTEDLARLML